MGKQHNSVSEMVRELCEESFDEFERMIEAKAWAMRFARIRRMAGMTQQEAADKLGWSKRWVVAMESTDDSELRLEDVGTYLSAFGLELRIMQKE